jgi:DNA-binding MarR family transcriptional regulator
MTRNITLPREHALHMRAFCASANLRRAARLVTRHYDRALKPIGVTAAQLPILSAISAGAGDSITELSTTLDIEASGLSRDLALLQKKGLVRLTTGEDRRSRKLELTAAGHRTIVRAFKAWKRAHAQLLTVVGESDFQKMLDQTKRMGRAVKTLR